MYINIKDFPYLAACLKNLNREVTRYFMDIMVNFAMGNFAFMDTVVKLVGSEVNFLVVYLKNLRDVISYFMDIMVNFTMCNFAFLDTIVKLVGSKVHFGYINLAAFLINNIIYFILVYTSICYSNLLHSTLRHSIPL